MKLLRQVNILNTSDNFAIPAGKYRGFLLRFSGTNQTGQQLAASDLGTIRLSRGGRQVMYASIDRIQVLNGFDFGAVESSSTAGDAFAFTAYIPASLPGDENIFFVSDEQTFMAWVGGSNVNNTVIASGTLEVYGDTADGIQAYELGLWDYDLSYSGAGTYAEKIPYENIARLLIENDAQLGRVTVNRDGETFISADDDALVAYTNLFTKTETYDSSISYILAELRKSGALEETLADDVRLELILNGSATLQCLVASVDFTPDQLQASKADFEQSVAQKTTRKASAGKTRPVKVLSALKSIA